MEPTHVQLGGDRCRDSQKHADARPRGGRAATHMPRKAVNLSCLADKTDAKSQRSGLGEKRPRDGNDPTGAMLAGTAKRHGGGGEREKAKHGQKMEEWSERRSCVQRGGREEASGEATSTTQTTVKDAWLP
ncbi:hypothetical protein ERJ75_000266100 [Trypanosoma vivax]|nr:hypothetical protein ERJ75_000266100 [Trypanosoma vivax]